MFGRMFERFDNKLHDYDFVTDETIINKITKNVDETAQNILQKNKDIKVEDLKNEIDKSLKEQNIPNYSKKVAFKNHLENEIKNHLNNQEKYLKEEEEKRKKEKELEDARR